MMDLLRNAIEHDEGYRDALYLDSKGYLTGGWGHKLVAGDPVTPEMSEAWIKRDIARAISDYDRLPHEYRRAFNTPRARVIVCMIYNMGLGSVMRFDKMWACAIVGDWPGVRREMLDSQWHTEVGLRAERLADIMLSGIWPEDYNV